MCMQDFDHNGGEMDSEHYLLGNVTEMRQTVILVAILSLGHIVLITAYATYTGELLMGYFITIRT